MDEYGYVENSIDINNERLSVIYDYNTYSNSTCSLKHGALYGQVSILSCSFNWGQPDSSLDMDALLSC